MLLAQNHGLLAGVSSCYKTSTAEVKLSCPVVFTGSRQAYFFFSHFSQCWQKMLFSFASYLKACNPSLLPFLFFLEIASVLPSPNMPSKGGEPAPTFEHLTKISMSHGCLLGKEVPWEVAGLSLGQDLGDS